SDARVRRRSPRGGRLQCGARASARVDGVTPPRRPRGVGRADPVRRDARLRQARDAVVGGVPPSLRPLAGGGGRPPAVLERRPAGLGRRAMARVVDGLLGVLVWSLTGMWLAIAAWGFRQAPLGLREVLLLALTIATLGVSLHVVYHVAFVGGCGQTPGSM